MALLRTSTAEPTPSLKAVLDLPLQVEVSADLAAELAGLETSVNAQQPDGPWGPIYLSAHQLVMRAVDELERRQEQLHAQLLDVPDPRRLQQELTDEPKKLISAAGSDLKSKLSDCRKEWIDRLKRQQQAAGTTCTKQAVTSLRLQETATPGAVELRLESNWWLRFRGFMSEQTSTWSDRVYDHAPAELREATNVLAADLARRLALDVRALTFDVRPAPPPRGEWEDQEETPVKRADVASVGAAFGAYLRSNVMAVGMLSTVIMGVAIAGGSLLGNVTSSGGAANAWMRGGLVIAALPLLTYLGLRAARDKRKKMRDTAIQSAQDTMRKHVSKEVQAHLERHRTVLERWLDEQIVSCQQSFDGWVQAEVVSAIEVSPEEVKRLLTEAKLQQMRLTEQLSTLKSQTTRMRQNLAFDLLKRLKTLQTGG